MKKGILKTGLAIGSLGAVASPVAMIVSCAPSSGSNFAGLGIKAINTGGYAGSMKKLANGDVSAIGSWGDSRFYAKPDEKKLHVVGVEKNRIANDGIQARPNMKPDDMRAVQNLFIELIGTANVQLEEFKAEKANNNTLKLEDYKNPKTLLMNKGTEVTTIFDVYSHANYVAPALNGKIGVLDGDKLKDINAYPGTNKPATGFSNTNAELFKTAPSLATASFTNEMAQNKFETKTGQILKIKFIPSNDASLVGEATTKLGAFLNALGVKSNITVSTSYDSAASALEAKQLDLAFLPAGTWATTTPNSNFILQASRPTQIATMNVSGAAASFPGTKLASEMDAIYLFNKYGQLYVKDIVGETAVNNTNPKNTKEIFLSAAFKTGTNEKKIFDLINGGTKVPATDPNMLAGSYESWIFTKIDSEFDKKIVGKNISETWKLPISDVKENLTYGYTSTTSSASYEFPEIWFTEHFTK